MIISLRRSGAALVAFAALALPAGAQDAQPAAQTQPAAAPQRPAATPSTDKTDQSSGQAAPAPQRPAQEQAKPRPAAPAPAKPDAATPQRPAADPATRAALLHKLVLEETKHRDRLAKLERLRQLADQKHDQGRLDAIAELLRKENERFGKFGAEGRKTLGEDGFRAANERLGQGRQRQADVAKRLAAKQEQRKEAAGQQQAAPAAPAAPRNTPPRKGGGGKAGQRPQGEAKPAPRPGDQPATKPADPNATPRNQARKAGGHRAGKTSGGTRHGGTPR